MQEFSSGRACGGSFKGVGGATGRGALKPL
jgi:hypothetical protein